MNIGVDPEHQEYIERWLHDEPEARVARLFVAEARNPGVELVEAIGHQLLRSMFAVSDTSVALARLGWWLDEFGQAEPRHPLTRALDDLGRSSDVATGLRGAAAGLLRLAQRETVQSIADLLHPLQEFSAALAAARGALRPDADVEPIVAAAVAGARLLSLVRDWKNLSLPARALLPLDLLARHAADRASAAHAAHPASALIAAELVAAGQDSLRGAASIVLRGIDGARIAAARTWANRMMRSPAHTVSGTLGVPRGSLVFALWRVGRRG